MKLNRAVVVAAMLNGCAAEPAPRQGGRAPTETTTASKSIDPRGRRSDPAPVMKRVPRLGSPQHNVWYGGSLGDDRAPGPSTYWVDAVVALKPGTAKGMLKRGGHLSARTIDTVSQLQPDRPGGPLMGSDALDRALSTDSSSVKAGLTKDHHILVLAVRSER